MANIKSSKQDIKKSLERRQLNQRHKGQMRGSVRRARTTLEHGTADAAETVRQAISLIDRAASKGAIHPNAAARRKSRLALKLNNAAKA